MENNKPKKSKGFKIFAYTSVALIVIIVAIFATGLHFLAYNFFQITQLTVSDKQLHMTGLINTKTPQQFYDIFEKNPQINTIVMGDVPGSIDDDANLEIASWIAKKGVTTKLFKDSHVASGGTDFFIAGKQRIIEKGALIGVHSWAGLNEVATDFPPEHEYHKPYINFYKLAGMSQDDAEDFYFFTLHSAPADDIHYMTLDEIKKYGIATKIKE